MTNTHACRIHNLVTCKGELRNETFSVTVRDQNGTIVYAGERTTSQNGFLGLWLPAGITGTITLSGRGLSASGTIETASVSATCLTTLKLS